MCATSKRPKHHGKGEERGGGGGQENQMSWFLGRLLHVGEGEYDKVGVAVNSVFCTLGLVQGPEGQAAGSPKR
jgi:hypothetical protein